MPRHLVVIVMIDAVTVDVTVVIDGVVARHSGDVDLDTADSTHSFIHSSRLSNAVYNNDT